MELIMYYVCVTEDRISSIINYEPACVWPMQAHAITDAEYAQIQAQTHYWDVTTSSVQPQPEHVRQMQAQQALNQACVRYLTSTDWQVLRHIRQIHLGEPTSLSPEEYTQLETERARRAALIKS